MRLGKEEAKGFIEEPAGLSAELSDTVETGAPPEGQGEHPAPPPRSAGDVPEVQPTHTR